MRDDAFRAFLDQQISRAAAGSYLSNLRTVERLLQLDLDHVELTDDSIRGLRSRLERAAMPSARINDCASALRQYCRFRDGIVTKTNGPRQRAARISPRSAFVTAASTTELMRLYADVLAELRVRKVTRTANGPVGDYAELLFAKALGWTLADNNKSYHDAVDTAGTRYQIKGRRMDSGPGGRQLGALRRLDEERFDVLAAVLFDRDMQVLRAALIPHRVVIERAKRVEHTNSWRFVLSDAVWGLPTVRDATEALRTSAKSL